MSHCMAAWSLLSTVYHRKPRSFKQ